MSDSNKFQSEGSDHELDRDFSELFKRFQQGEESLVTVLVEKFPDLVKKLLEQRLRGTPEQAVISASEVMQSSFMQAMKKRDQVAAAENIAAYVRRMSLNKLEDRKRKLYGRTNSKTTEPEADESSIPDSTLRERSGHDEALANAASKEKSASEMFRTRDEFEQKMASLTDDERILMEVWLADEDWQIAADMLGISRDAARQRFAELIKKMKKQFGIGE